MTRGTAAARVVTAVLVVHGAASAQQPPDFLMTWDASNDGVAPYEFNWEDVGEVKGPGHFDWPPWGVVPAWNYHGSLPGPGGNSWNLAWSCLFNDGVAVSATGPRFVLANVVITNTDTNEQSFSLLMTLPIAGVIVTPQERGSITGTVSDIFGDGATLSAPDGSRIYTPGIDGADEASGFLMNDPFSQSAGPFLSALVGPAEFGMPVPVPASQDVDAGISLQLQFDLTPGDSASFSLAFEVMPVPGPGAVALLGALGVLGVRRRRRSEHEAAQVNSDLANTSSISRSVGGCRT